MSKKERYHVLVLAMSDLYDVRKVEYQAGNRCLPYYGQLEVIPLYLSEIKHETITHIIILETGTVKKAIKEIDKEDPEGKKNVFGALQKNAAELLGTAQLPENISATSFFEKRIEYMVKTGRIKEIPEFIHIGISEKKMETGFSKLLKKIQELYRDCMNDGGDWKLWLDIHGAFREISMGFFSLLQNLSIGDVDNDPKYSEVIQTVPVTSVYTTDFRRGKPARIINRTKYYEPMIGNTLKKYANYGQYFLKSLQPAEEPPYVFIGYKHRDDLKTRYALMGFLKEKGLRFWYDDGIHLTKDWEKNVDEHIIRCDVFFAFVTPGYFSSFQCMRELKLALDNEKSIVFFFFDGCSPGSSKEPYLSGINLTDDKGNNIKIPSKEFKKLLKLQHINLFDSNTPYINNDFTVQERLIERIKQVCSKPGLINNIE